MKKLCAILLTAVLLLTLAACGGDAPKDLTPEERLEAAQGLIGEDVEKLYDAIGQPDGSSYASSCIGDGEDGELSYDGFHVYTYRAPDGAESVQDVLPLP